MESLALHANPIPCFLLPGPPSLLPRHQQARGKQLPLASKYSSGSQAQAKVERTLRRAHITRRGVTCSASSSQQQEEKVEVVTRISPKDESTEDADYASQHPWDPHAPAFSPLLPKAIRPYPSFEGWFLRLVDFGNNLSIGVIMATNYATAECQVTLLFTISDEQARHRAGNGSSDSLRSGCTYRVFARSKESKFTLLPPSKETKNSPKGFEWEAPNLGHMIAKPHETIMEVTVEGYKFKSRMVHEVLWDDNDSSKGPEGWASKISILPTHWYVYSLGSEASYELSNEEKGVNVKGCGLAHQEKNWGETFPSGHVWLQGFSKDNDCQVVASGAYYNIGERVKTPYIFAMGFRSPDVKIDMRTNDPGVVFKDIEILPLERKFSVTAVGPSHSIQIKASAPLESFSEPLLCPMGKLSWEPACRESYFASVKVEVFEHAVWGVVGDQKLVDRRVFDIAGLEFGEDLMQEAEK